MGDYISDIVIFAVTVGTCVLNHYIPHGYPSGLLGGFLKNYFDDLVGCIGFMAYCGVVFRLAYRSFGKLWQVLLLSLVCSVFWEVITPLYRKGSTPDFWDTVMYFLAGFVYWIICRMRICASSHK